MALCVVVGGLLLSSSPALAASEVDHVFGRSFTGTGKCAFKQPGGVAVNDSTEEVYVFDRATNSIDRFSSTGACLTHHKVSPAATGEAGEEGIAVDNSGSQSAGDLYVVDAEEHAILKFKPEAAGILKRIAKIQIFKEAVKEIGEEPEEYTFEGEMHGIAVDASGDLWVYQGEVIDRFAGTAIKNQFLSYQEVSGNCSPRPGFAVTANAEFFVGRERENHKEECEPTATTLMKLNSAGEPSATPTYKGQLDGENTTGVAVDRSNGDVYFDNGTSMSAFSPIGFFMQRFGDEEGSAHLQQGAGIAVDSTTNDVYVADAHEGKVEVFIPKSSKESPPAAGQEPADHRAWEMVSPQNKFGASIFPITKEWGLVQASEDGSAIAYSASGPLVAAPASNRSPEPAAILSRREASGWSTQDIAAPHSQVPIGYKANSGDEYRFFSSDLSLGLLEPEKGIRSANEPPLSPEATETTLYWRNTTTPGAACEPTPSTCYQALVSPANDTTHNPFGGKLRFLGATPDARHAVLTAEKVALTPQAVELKEEEGLYESSTGGSLRLVSVLPEGETGPAGDARLGAFLEPNARNAISNDGTRVIWSAEEALYMRDMTTGETIRVDKAQGVPQPEETGAVFQTASADGSKIFFTDRARLTPHSTEAAEEEVELGDLYVCEVVQEAGTGKPACKLKDLTAEVAAPNENAAVQGALGASEDGSYVYFVADGVLAPGAGRGQCEVQPPPVVVGCNLYVEHHNGAGWEQPKFIAALTSQDAPDWRLAGAGLAEMTSRVSPNGHYLAFMSDRSLTGYNNIQEEEIEEEGKKVKVEHADEEVFLYNASTNRVLCASCNPRLNPKGEPKQPVGVYDNESVGGGQGLLIDQPKSWSGRWLAANIPGWTGPQLAVAALYQSRYLSDNGRLFFNSADPLVPAATNGKADVYEYEPNGEGTCESETGCIALISSGTSNQESAFLDASASGDNVFFLTAEKLVAQDQDTAFDVYDAHVCTSSSPCSTPPEKPLPPCKEEACRAPISSQPALPSVPPSALPGPGNVATQQALGVKTEVKAKPLTRAQKLAKALKACKKLKKNKRAACNTQARKKYGPPLTRAQKLAKALKACKKLKKNKRAACNTQAGKKYGPLKNGKK